MFDHGPLIQELILRNGSGDNIFATKTEPRLLICRLKDTCKVELAAHLECLKVQSKLLDSINLESSFRVWRYDRILACLADTWDALHTSHHLYIS